MVWWRESKEILEVRIMENEIKRELILCIAAEGDGSDIYLEVLPDGKQRIDEVNCSIWDADNLDLTEEEFKKRMDKKTYYNSFEEFWKSFANMEFWYKLHFYKMSDNVKIFIGNKLRKKRRELISTLREIDRILERDFKL
jgi:hypothetical protein